MLYESTVQRNNSARSVHAKLCGQMFVTYNQNMAAVENDTGKSLYVLGSILVLHILST